MSGPLSPPEGAHGAPPAPAGRPAAVAPGGRPRPPLAPLTPYLPLPPSKPPSAGGVGFVFKRTEPNRIKCFHEVRGSLQAGPKTPGKGGAAKPSVKGEFGWDYRWDQFIFLISPATGALADRPPSGGGGGTSPMPIRPATRPPTCPFESVFQRCKFDDGRHQHGAYRRRTGIPRCAAGQGRPAWKSPIPAIPSVLIKSC